MTGNELPIDPEECGISFEAVDSVHGVLRARVPAALVRRFRKKMRKAGREADTSEVRTTLINFLCHCAATKFALRFVAGPMVRRGAKEPRLSTDHDFAVDLEFDTAASLEYPQSVDVELLEPTLPVNDELIEEEMQRQRVQAGARTAAAAVERPGEAAISLELRVEEGDRPIHTDPSLRVTLDGGGALHALATSFAGAADELVGVAVGDTKIIRSAFPADHPSSVLRGKSAILTVTVRSAAAIAPASVEEVVAQYGTSTEARLRTQIRFALEQQRSQSIQATLREQMLRALPRLFPIGMPECRSRMLCARAEAEFRTVGRARGWNDDRADLEWNAVRAKIEGECAEAARRRTILQSLPAGTDVDVGEGTINARIADLASRRGMRPEEVRAQLVKTGRFDEFAVEVIAEAMLDALVRRARIRTVSPEEWRAAMEAGRE